MANTAFEANENPTSIYLKTGLLGFVAGLRSMTPLALLNWTSRIGVDAESALEQFLDAPASRLVASTLALGEIVGDKLPFAPSRLAAGPLIGRIVIGGLAGAALCQRNRVSPVVGAAIGATAASVGSAAGYYARKTLDEIKFVPDFVWASAEDALALGLGYLATRKPKLNTFFQGDRKGLPYMYGILKECLHVRETLAVSPVLFRSYLPTPY